MSTAFQRNGRGIEKVIHDVMNERERQDTLWGPVLEQQQTQEKRLAILVEEVGEYAQAVLEHKHVDAYIELIQIAAVAVANAERYHEGLR